MSFHYMENYRWFQESYLCKGSNLQSRKKNFIIKSLFCTLYFHDVHVDRRTAWSGNLINFECRYTIAKDLCQVWVPRSLGQGRRNKVISRSNYKKNRFLFSFWNRKVNGLKLKLKANNTNVQSKIKYVFLIFSKILLLCSCQIIFTARKRSLGQDNIFAPVCHSFHRGEYLGRYQHWQVPPLAGTHPLDRYTPGRYIPHPQGRYTLSLQVHPLADTPLAGTPPCRYTPTGTPPSRYTPSRYPPPPAIHAGIWSTSGRYASYWNAFLL